MAPQRDLHAAAVSLTQRAVEKAFGEGFWVRPQLPVHLDRYSGPEPDVSVVPGGPRDFVGTGHPKTTLLLIEISESTLWYDRQRKGPRYARAKFPDYWIVNLVDRCVETYRNPVPDPSARLGWRYAEVNVLNAPAMIRPLAASGEIAVADLLP